MIRMQYMSLLLLGLVSLTGCASMQNGIAGHEAKIRHKCQAQKAWHEWSWCYEEVDHRHHFAKGFKAGYRDILEGGKGCQPTLPPRCYWKSCYRSAEGRCKVNAWFDGFSHGALAAQQDGVAAWNQIPLSPTARMNLQMANSQPQVGAGAFYGTPLPVAAHEPPALPLISVDETAPQNNTQGQTLLNVDDEVVPPRPYE